MRLRLPRVGDRVRIDVPGLPSHGHSATIVALLLGGEEDGAAVRLDVDAEDDARRPPSRYGLHVLHWARRK